MHGTILYIPPYTPHFFWEVYPLFFEILPYIFNINKYVHHDRNTLTWIWSTQLFVIRLTTPIKEKNLAWLGKVTEIFLNKLFPFMFVVNAWYIDIVKQCFKAVKRSPLLTF